MVNDALANRLFLIDGSSLAYRAYFALPETIAMRDGFPTNALYGFSQMLLKIVGEYEPAAVIVAWDAREKTFRHEEFEEYKAHRPHMPEPLSEQWSRFPELVDAFGFRNLVRPGYEADDILGTLAEAAKRNHTGSVVVTGDRDALQIVDDDVWVMSTGRGITDVKIYTPAKVVERYGVTADKVPDFIGLKGDTSDNIPGVPGIGEKTAAALIQQFGSLEAIYERLAEVTSDKRRALLVEHEQQARLSKRLATMVLDVPLDVDLDELVSRGGYELPVHDVEDVFRRFEFNSLVRRVHDLASRAAAPAEPDAGTSPAVATVAGMPRLVIENDIGPLAAVLEQQEAALAFVHDDGHETAVAGGGAAPWVAAVYAGGEAVQAASVSEQQWRSLWLLAQHVVAHDAKSYPGFAQAPAGPAFDTAIAAYLLRPELPQVSLLQLAGVNEAEGLIAGPDREAAAAVRAVLAWRVKEAQAPRLEELELGRLLREIELPLVRVLAQMEAVGIKMDPYRLGEITARVRDAVDELRDRIHKLAGGEFNIGSTRKLADVLFTHLGLQPVRKGKTGFSTDARVLKALRDEHPIVPAIEEWREFTKLLNTYLEPLPVALDSQTGRLHTTFNQTVASTGRLSSSSPNLQNIPARSDLGSEIRACFVAEEGHRLIVADYSQIELRLMAFLAQEPALLEAYRRGEDVHSVTAAAVAGIPQQQVSKRQRERAKATNFGIMYGLSAFGLSEQVDMDVEEARAFIDAYFAKYPKVKEFRERVIAQAARDGHVTTLFGRRRALPELRSQNHRERSLGERLAVNTVLQGTAADIIKVAMVEATRRFERGALASRLVLQVHDELVFECPQAEVDEVVPLVRQVMCDAYVVDPPLEVSIGVGDNWRDAK